MHAQTFTHHTHTPTQTHAACLQMIIYLCLIFYLFIFFFLLLSYNDWIHSFGIVWSFICLLVSFIKTLLEFPSWRSGNESN